jgi:coenzyme F420 hydrogenase subunit delta
MERKESSVVVFGCGNVIMGDDGFGPAVIDRLICQYDLPSWVQVIDAGTCVREYLFDYLLCEEGRPRQMIILDAVDFAGRRPGEVFEIEVDQIPARKIHDFSLHQFPTVNLLQELQENTGIQILILAAQVEVLPDEIAPGLSPSMSGAVAAACRKISKFLQLNVNEGELA